MTRPENYKEAYEEERDLRIALQKKLKDCRNELCIKCGDYTRRHLGACDGCRWRNV
jgi:hypothetical protein